VELNDAYAMAGAVSLGTLAALYGVVWRSIRSRWSACFAAASLLMAAIYTFDRFTLPAGSAPHPIALSLALVASIFLVEGMTDYVGLPSAWRRLARVGAVAIGIALSLAVALGMAGRLATFAVYCIYLATVAAMATWAMAREPRSGHGLVLAAVALYPLLVGAAVAHWVPVPMLRYAMILPLAAIGTTLLTTGLLRAQRRADAALRHAERAEESLRAANESLEHRVAERTADLQEMVAALEGFNRSVSHDLRGPLGGIAGASRLVEQALQRGDIRAALRFVPAITQQAETSTQLVHALLTLARVGDAQYAPRRLALERLVREALQLLRLADQKLSAIPIEIITPLPEVEADPDLLRQVYVNLVGNAMKFSRQSSSPRIEIGTVARGSDERVFFVRDNGVGFDSSKAQQLFEPFQRLHSDCFHGHGVGLSIVKRIVQRHGGRVWAESAPGQGATFFFTLGERQAA
jgi:signal transduction histidine kinase